MISIVCLAAVAVTAIYVYGQTPSKQGMDSQSVSVSSQTNGGHAGTTAISTSTDWKKQFLGDASVGNSFTTSKGSPQTNSEENLTATDRFSRDVFTQYANLKQSGLINNSAMVSTTVSDILAKDFSGSDKPRIYAASDISINPDNSTTALKAYGNIVGLLLQTYGPKQDSGTLALAGMQGKDTSYAQELTANATAYSTILTRLLAIPAPRSVSTYHLGLVNGASYMMYIASALSVSGTDPMRALNGLSMYQTAYTLGLQNLLMIRSTLAKAGITYGSSEGGSFFINLNNLKP